MIIFGQLKKTSLTDRTIPSLKNFLSISRTIHHTSDISASKRENVVTLRSFFGSQVNDVTAYSMLKI